MTWELSKVIGLTPDIQAYVDAVAVGLIDPKASCRAATTANITLSGAQTIDGVSVIAGDRVLVKDQSSGGANGIYVCAAGAWSRSTDADVSAEVSAGLYVFIEEGSTNADSGWILSTNNPITLGTTALTFVKFTSLGGDVVGPASSIANEVLRASGTGGKTLKASGLVIGDAASSQIPLQVNTATTGLLLQGNITTGTTPAHEFKNQNSLTASSGVQVSTQFSPTLNQTSTAGYTALRVLATETGTGSGQKDLLSLETAAATRLRVNNLGDLVQSSAATGGHVWHNVADETTNTETATGKWSANQFQLRTESTGSGTVRNMLLGPVGGYTFTMGSTGTGILSGTVSTSASPSLALANSNSFASTSAVQASVSITGTVNQTSGTGGYTGLLINPTLTAVGSAGAKLIDAQTAGTSRFSVASSGTVTVGGACNVASHVQLRNTTAIPAGGATGQGLQMFSATNFGVFGGSGAPSLSAAKGSLYLRSDGSGTNDRMYVNTDGGTTWTALVTVA